ncbi:fad NAD binding oxidoreductase [Hortaea werneckii]|nr:fad NAD binding oxidoreductase [Hortaea werneckii]
MHSPEKKDVVIIGGGAIGASVAYYLTRHPSYDPSLHSITLLEATSIAGGSSGKAGGLVAEWATPSCLAPLSFRKHAELAESHGGDKLWGHRHVHCAEVALEARDLDNLSDSTKPEIDWLAPGVLKSYTEIGNLSNSAQVNPFLFTTNMARLAAEKGVQVIIGKATDIKYSSDDDKSVTSVDYTTQTGSAERLDATDVIVAAGPWTPRLFPQIQLQAPRGHSVVIKPTSPISPHVLFPTISPALDSGCKNLISPELYPRPPDALYDFETVYSAGPDDYDAPLPSSTDEVAVNPQKCDAITQALSNVSPPLQDGQVLVRQACYKPQIRAHDDGEEVGPMVGPLPGAKGLWLATGHDEWGMSNSAGTGVVLSEMVFEGRAKSADVGSLYPGHFVRDD